MPVIAITHRLYSAPRRLIKLLEKALGCAVYTDNNLLEMTAGDHEIKIDLLHKVVRGKSIPFNKFTRDREKSLAALMTTLSKLLIPGNCILSGVISLLIPSSVTHVFRILASAPQAHRISRALSQGQQSEREALAAMENFDRYAIQWAENLRMCSPWDPSLYNLVIPPDGIQVKGGPDKASAQDTDLTESQTEALVDQIRQRLEKPPFTPPHPREQELFDFRIDAEVAMVLAPISSGLIVSSSLGNVMVTLDRKVMNLVQVQQKIMAAVSSVPGVKSVKTQIGPNYYKSNIIRNFDFGHSPRYGKSERERGP